MNKVPKLRFPEFSGEWEKVKIKDFIEVRKGAMKIGPFGSQLKKDTFVKEGYKVYGQENIFIKNFDFGDRYITESHFNQLKSNELKPGDFVISTMGTIGKCAIVPEGIKQGIMDSHIIRLQLEKNKIIPQFLSQLFSSEKIIKQVKNLSVGGIMEGLSIGIVNDLIFPLTKIREQEKIASFLSEVDKSIELLEQEKELWEQYKKGMMQKIFSQKIRFKDENGNDYPEWEEKKLGEVSECLDNRRKPLNSAERALIEGKIPYYGANGIQGFINKFIFEQTLVLLAEDGGNFEEFKTKPIAQLIKGKSWVNNHAHVLKGSESLLVEFLFYSVVHKDIREYINGTSRSKLNKSDMLKIRLQVPSLPEQEKIADFLSAIDEKIETIVQELESSKEFKKGLLQQMFV